MTELWRRGRALVVARARALFKEEEGLTIVEYAVAGGLITVAAIAAFTLLGGTVAGVITAIDTALSAAGGGGA